MLNEIKEVTMQCWNANMHNGKQMQGRGGSACVSKGPVKNAGAPRGSLTRETFA